MVMPGDNVTMSVELIAPIAMDEGLRFAIREGGRTVGAGVVASIKKKRQSITHRPNSGTALNFWLARQMASQDVRIRLQAFDNRVLAPSTTDIVGTSS